MGVSSKKKIIMGVSFGFIIFAFIVSTIFFTKQIFKNDAEYMLINIKELSEEFMDNYFEEYNKLEKEEKENMLIVISSKKISAEEYGAKEVIESPNNKYYILFEDDLSKEQATNKLNKEESVKSVEENIVRKILTVDNDIDAQNNEKVYNSWGIKTMGLDYATNMISDLETSEVTVAIIDTGLDVDLFNKYYSGRLKNTHNVLADDKDTSMYDNVGHGTHIAGTIAEGTPDNVKILPVKVSDSAYFLDTDILAALEYITYYADVDVINMSFGGYNYSQAEYQAIEAARQENIIAVAAAGNENTSSPMYPAAFDNTISIASVDSSLNKSEFSNYGNTIDFAAPGTDIKSIMASYMEISENKDGDEDHETISGTSMATPHAVAAVAILKSLNKGITLENVIDLLKEITVDLGGRGFDTYYGNGLINYNEVNFCANEEMSCDELNIFKVIKPINMTINEITYTSYNYGSLSNIMGTTVYFEEADGFDYSKKLWELDDLTITGYDPYNNDEQIITVNYLDFELSIKVDNPDNYESGWEYQLYNEKYYLSKYKDNGINIGKLYFPEQIDGLTISGILNSNDEKSILFNSSNDSNYFEEIILPSNIIEVGSYAFAELPKCTSVISEASEIIANENSFSNMINLTTVEGNISFTENSYSAFENDIALVSVTISENTSNILPNSSFKGCISLKSISIPNTITSIDGYAFYESGLISIKLSDNLKSIGTLAFGDSNLESISLPNSLEEIGSSSFSSNNLKSINIPKNVNVISEYAFAYNPLLDNITVDEENEFYDSRNDSNVIIETSTNKLVQGSNNAIIPLSVVEIGDNSFAGLYIKELNVPEGVTSIGEDAFLLADFLEKIILPNSLTNIHSSNFIPYEELDEIKLIDAASSGGVTAIGETVLWVNEDSYAYEFAINNDNTYVIIEDSADIVKITNEEFLTEKNIFFPEERYEDYIKWIKYYYIDGEEIKSKEVQNYKVEYQNGDSISINDYAVFIKFDLEHSYRNIKIPAYINVTEKVADIELPVIEVVIGEDVCKYEFPAGTFKPYKCTTYNEAGDYTLLGDYTFNETGETIFAVEVIVHVLNKELVRDDNTRILAKIYDGTTNLEFDNVILSYTTNIKPSDYTIISAELNSPDVSRKTSVRIKARINDDSYEKFAFSGNKQEIEFIGYTAVIDFEIPEINLLIGEFFNKICLEDGCLSSSSYLNDGAIINGTPKFEKAGDYTAIGSYSYNDSSGRIDDIAIPVHVINKKIVMGYAEVEPKEYDGTTNIDINTITLPNIDKSQYTIISAVINEPIFVCDYCNMANIKVKLNDTFYENYAFSGNKQELEWVNPITIIKRTPKYDVPKNLKAELGQSLYDISLPNGFEWTSENEVFSEVGIKTYEAKYTPEDTENYNVIENIKVTINVSAKTVAITFNSNGGTGSMDKQEFTYDTLQKINKNIYKRSGYKFIGWNTKTDGTGTSYSDNEEIKLTENITLYAIWEESYSYIINKYSVDDENKYIDLIDINTTVDEFINNIDLNYRYTVEVDSIYMLENELDLLYTGGKTRIYKDNALYCEYTNIIRGDVNGDGVIGIIDYIRIMKDIMDTTKLTGAYMKAADVNQNGKIDIIDYIRVMKMIMEEN